MNGKRWVGKIAVWVTILLQLAIFQAGTGWAWTGKVVGIADGDTITVLRDGRDQVKIRLYGIDAPESGHPFGKQSKQNLSSMVYGQSVQVDVMDTDRYGRTVARIFVDGEDVNAAQLRSGHAWLYRQYCKGWRMGWARSRSEVDRGRAVGRQGSDAPLAVAPR